MDDVIRGVGVGGMLASGVAAGWLFLVGSLFDLEDPSDITGKLLHTAGFLGMASAVVAGYGLIVGERRPAAAGAIAQSVVAVALLIWWVVTDFWSGANEPSAYYIVPLVSLVALDALVVMWAVRVGHRVSE